MERRSVGVLGREQETLTLHKMCMSPHLYPLPARCTGLACTGAGRGQGEGQVPLKMKDHHATEKPVSLSSEKGMVHASHAFYATIRETQRGEAATDRSAPVPGRSNVGSLAVWEHSRASSQASLAAAGTAALREISSQLANDFDHCSAAAPRSHIPFLIFLLVLEPVFHSQ